MIITSWVGCSPFQHSLCRPLGASQVALVVKNPAANAGDVPWVGKIPWRRKWQPIPVFLPGEPMDRGAWQATVHGVTKNQTRLERLSTHTHLVVLLLSCYRKQAAVQFKKDSGPNYQAAWCKSMTVSKTMLEEEEYKILTRSLLITNPTASPYLYIPRFLMRQSPLRWLMIKSHLSISSRLCLCIFYLPLVDRESQDFWRHHSGSVTLQSIDAVATLQSTGYAPGYSFQIWALLLSRCKWA